MCTTGGNGTLIAGSGFHHGLTFFDRYTGVGFEPHRSSGVVGEHRTRRPSPANRAVRSTSTGRPSIRSCHGASGHQSWVPIGAIDSSCDAMRVTGQPRRLAGILSAS